MVERHLSRLAAPKSWKIKRKGIKFIIRPNPGAYPFDQGMPLALLLRDYLGLASTMKEVKYILHKKEVLVDGVKVKEPKHIVGFMNVITIPEHDISYRVLFGPRGRLVLVRTDKKEAVSKICRIKNKSDIKGTKTVMHLHDGNNLIVENGDFKPGDSVLLDLKEKRITQHLPLKKGACIFLSGGRYIGNLGTLMAITHSKVSEDTIIVKIGNDQFTTLKKYAFVVGAKKPALQSLQEK